MRISATVILVAHVASPLAAQTPLSAIDWLEAAPQSLPLTPPAPLELGERDGLAEPAAAGDARAPDVTVTTLDAPRADGVGLLPPNVTGFPATLWAGAEAQALSDALEALPMQMPVPAAQSLLMALLLAEAAPPPGPDNAFLAARVDALLARGAVGPAQEMLRLVPDLGSTKMMSRAMQLALLFGETTGLCAEVAKAPRSLPDPATQVYCLAQSSRWPEAVTTLEAARALGDIEAGRYERLIRFLDPELAEELPSLPPPATARLDALDYRLMAASGEVLATTALPLKFATADLDGSAGWKARIEASERLVRAGALGEAPLFEAYGAGRPAASGGVWERARSIQALDRALDGGNPEAIGPALQEAWRQMRSQGLLVPFAQAYAARLAPETLAPPARAIAQRMALLSPDYEIRARALTPQTPALRFAVALAQGAPTAPFDAPSRAIAAAWSDTDALAQAQSQLAGRGVGLAMLEALATLVQGVEGDPRRLTPALVDLRALGLEDAARRIALQVVLADGARP